MDQTANAKVDLVRAWIVFLEKRYYTLKVVYKENGRFGVVRKIPLKLLHKMMWGDKICCFYKMASLIAPLWYATWPITKLEGLSKAALRCISDNCKSTPCNLGGRDLIRGYGSYTTGITYKVDASLNRIGRLLMRFDPTGEAVGDLMIGCGPNVMKRRQAPFPAFPNISIDEELIRPFNYMSAITDIRKTKGRKRGVGKGFYLLEQMNDPDYSWPLNPSPEIPAKNYVEDMEGGVGCGLVQTALNYISAEERVEHIAF